MKAFIKDFNTRIDEINEYFTFVAFIDSIETHKKEKIINIYENYSLNFVFLISSSLNFSEEPSKFK